MGYVATMKARLVAVSAAVLIAAAAPVANSAGSSPLSQEETATRVDEVVVTARREAELLALVAAIEAEGGRAVAVPDDNQIACLSAAIRATEAGKDGMAQRGASWARQDVRAVMASPLEQAIDHCAMFADGDLRRNGRTQWSEALADALTAARTTLMVMPISVAAEAGGLLDQAAARGLEVSGPEWRVSSAHEGG